ncbi:MAG TPA: hypothetical protein PKB09_03945 [Candidatus Saccharibacteria bacterium]|nr:hypothetical protein [Candidatus Saccharibacteria bacterium]
MKTKHKVARNARKTRFSENLEKINLVLISLSLVFYLYTFGYGLYSILAPSLGRQVGLEGLIVIFTGGAALFFNVLLLIGLVVQVAYDTKNHRLAKTTKRLLVVAIILPFLGAALLLGENYLAIKQDNYMAAKNEKLFNDEHIMLKDGRFRSKADDKFLKSFKPNVYLPKWENENAVSIIGKDLEYFIEYNPNKTRSGDYDYDNSDNEHYYFLIKANNSSLKKFVNPPYNCDIDGVIPPSSRQPRSVPCIEIGMAINGSVIYGQDNWMGTENAHYAVIFFDNKSPHLIRQTGGSEKIKGGELQQLIDWQRDFRKFDKNGLLLVD